MMKSVVEHKLKLARPRFQQAQGELSGALSRLLVTVERYPELKANQNFLNLQTQLEGTENRIKVSRNDFNTSVQQYNQVVSVFAICDHPHMLVADFVAVTVWTVQDGLSPAVRKASDTGHYISYACRKYYF